jgi:hypothetical protein
LSTNPELLVEAVRRYRDGNGAALQAVWPSDRDS